MLKSQSIWNYRLGIRPVILRVLLESAAKRKQAFSANSPRDPGHKSTFVIAF